METVRHDPQPPLIGDRDIPVRQSRPHRMRDRGNSRRYADPQPIAGIARDEVHLADRLALDLIIQRARLAIRAGALQHAGADIGDEKFAMLAERNTVRQARLCVGGDLRHRPDRGFLFDQPLGLSVARYIYDPSRVGYPQGVRSEEHTSELQSLMRISYAVFCLKKNNTKLSHTHNTKQYL